ncbi:hypothetical protein [Streptomyces sp. NPDC007264]|uniref:hypothetical protein n=1 Tax=Streptomyces sp. NPDC007264 TaxID=3364777 RepID=UPI0036DE24E5
MSTPNTSEPRRQRRTPLDLIPGRDRGQRATGAGRTTAAPLPRTRGGGPTVISDPAESRLLKTARARGGRAARRGVVDPWILQNGDRVPYFVELAAVRDRVIGRIGEEAGLAEEQARLADARAETDVSRCEADTALIEHELREAEENIATAKGQLDLLAQRATRWNRFRDSVRARLEARWMEARFPSATPPGPARGTTGDGLDGGPGTAGDPGDPGDSGGPGDPGEQRATYPEAADDEDPEVLQSVPRTGEAPRAAGTDDRHGAGRRQDAGAPGTGRQQGAASPYGEPLHGLRDQLRPAATDVWEGLTKRPGIPAWMNWSMLFVIFLVELPIYYAAYESFHGIGVLSAQAQTLVLALGTGVAMVFFPHLAGRILRWRPATGSVRSSWIPAYLLIGVWISLTGFLGVLRSKYLLQDANGSGTGTGTGDTGGFAGLGGGAADGHTDTLVERLHLSSTTVTSLFVALLVLSGGIGLLLGLFQEHPFLKVYRSALERRTELVADHQRSVAATERARATMSTAQARREHREEAREDRIRAVHALYDAAAAAYLDGVATKSGDPAVTEAAMKLSRTWPLLPAPAHR